MQLGLPLNIQTPEGNKKAAIKNRKCKCVRVKGILVNPDNHKEYWRDGAACQCECTNETGS